MPLLAYIYKVKNMFKKQLGAVLLYSFLLGCQTTSADPSDVMLLPFSAEPTDPQAGVVFTTDVQYYEPVSGY